MLNEKVLSPEILTELFKDTDKILLEIDRETKILDYSKTFKPYYQKFKYLKELITYTHLNDFLEQIKNINETKPLAKFLTNFSFDKNNVEDIPKTYEVILSYNNKNSVVVLADPKSSLSDEDVKLYLSLVNELNYSTRELTKTKFKLQNLNHALEEKVQDGVNDLRKKDEILIKQAKDAAMGEMIDSIAHQWKNPLGTIKVAAGSAIMEYQLNGKLNTETVFENANIITTQVDHLVETLEEFRGFFRPHIKLENVSLEKLIQSVKVLMNDNLIKNNINIQILDCNKTIEIVPNQFKHVLINLISNSIDAFNENSIQNRQITFLCKENKHDIILTIEDTAGGIASNVIENIFEANVTTKSQGKGTGIGLYMTKLILDKINAKIEVKNVNDGVIFKIILPKKI